MPGQPVPPAFDEHGVEGHDDTEPEEGEQDPREHPERIVVGEIAERLSAQIKEAIKSGDRTRLQTVRLLATSVRNREVELGRDLTEDDLVEVATREMKRRKEAAEAYDRAGRTELAERERAEGAILEAYLPEQLSEEEVRTAIEEAVASTGATGPGDMGKVMAQVMGRFRGRVDGGEVNRLVRERLGVGGAG